MRPFAIVPTQFCLRLTSGGQGRFRFTNGRRCRQYVNTTQTTCSRACQIRIPPFSPFSSPWGRAGQGMAAREACGGSTAIRFAVLRMGRVAMAHPRSPAADTDRKQALVPRLGGVQLAATFCRYFFHHVIDLQYLCSHHISAQSALDYLKSAPVR